MTEKRKPPVIEGEIVEKSQKPEQAKKPAAKKPQQFVSERIVGLAVLTLALIVGGYYGYPYLSGWVSSFSGEEEKTAVSQEIQAGPGLEERVRLLEGRVAEVEHLYGEMSPSAGPEDGLEARIAALENKISQVPVAAGEAGDSLQENLKIAEMATELTALKNAFEGLVASQRPYSPGFSGALAKLAPPLYQSRPFAGELEQVRIYILEMPALDQATLSAPVSVLSKYAHTGIADIAGLQEEFSKAGLEALRTEGLSPDAGWWQRTWAKIKGQVVIRRTDGTGASTLEAAIAKAEAYLAAGEAGAAFDLISALPANQSGAFQDWVLRAGQRAEALEAFEALTGHISKQVRSNTANR
ncbi:MAG: hypothetical protein IID52_01045 [Proteobacteria bacterium]|nr:hypothetical protein [Pseudomonadota bacterium]